MNIQLKNKQPHRDRILLVVILLVLGYSNGYAISSPNEKVQVVSEPAPDQIIYIAQSTTEENSDEEEEEEPDCD